MRLLGIDTPETRAPGKPVQCYGPAAAARVKRLLPVGQTVRLVTDPTQDTRDRYARLLAYVYKPGRSGARGSVNHSLVATGHAKAYVYGGVRFRYADAFFRAQHRARKAQTRPLRPAVQWQHDEARSLGHAPADVAACDPASGRSDAPSGL